MDQKVTVFADGYRCHLCGREEHSDDMSEVFTLLDHHMRRAHRMRVGESAPFRLEQLAADKPFVEVLRLCTRIDR